MSSHPRRPKRPAAVRALLLPTLLLLAGLVAGCGQETPPGEAVPALASRLERVDDAVEARNNRKARDAVEGLVAETTRAEEAGEISGEQADRILAAADDLLARLPADAPTKDPSPTPTQPSPEPPEEEGEGDEEKKDEDKGKDDKDKDEKKDEDGGNGPDDGHGN